MDFNLFVLVVPIVIGIVAGMSAEAPAGGLSLSSLVRPLIVGLVLSLGAVGVTIVATDRDGFALAHILYTLLTIAVPIAAFIMFTRTHGGSSLVRFLLFIAILGAPIGLYASHLEPFWLRTDTVEIEAVPELESLRIGVLADFQTGEVGSYENEAVATLLAQNPDIVLIPGDFWQMTNDEFNRKALDFAAVFARLDNEVDHVIAVNGNSDNVNGLRRLAARTDVLVLDNEVVEVETRGIRVRVGGLSLGGDQAKVPTMLEELSAGDEGVARILLAHKPDAVYEIGPQHRVDLVVAGHTHGGQIQIPFFGPIVTFSDVPRDVAAGGLHAIDGQPVYVSTGVGREKFRAPQVRFWARPSIGVINFVPAATSSPTGTGS